jgi:hypothetical protein
MSGRPVFVVGAPRTGTTLVKEILNRHPRIHLFDEVHFFERVWDDRDRLGDLADEAGQNEAIERLRKVVLDYGTDQAVAELLTVDVFRRRLDEEGGGYRGLLAALLKTGAELAGADHWGDSSPQDVLYLSTLFEWFPDARIVALVRDPRGFLCSYKNYFRRKIPGYRERYNPLTNGILWRSYMAALLEASRGPRASAIRRVRYEDLVADPETEVRGLCEHVGVEFTSDLLEVTRTNTSFAEESASSSGNAEVARGIVGSSKDRWRTELSRTEIWVGERVFGNVMRELGYVPAPEGAGWPSPFELVGILAVLPGRLFNMLFRSPKPFRMAKMKRVLSLLRPHSSP